MKVAVITPYHSARPEWLAECVASVRAQTHPCTHFLVSDGVGPPPLENFEGQVIQLPRGHRDYGDTPRAVGSMMAMGQGYDAIAYLDDDNWYQPEHIEGLVRLHRGTGAALCSAGRMLHALDGRALVACPHSNGVHFVDTNCYFVTRSAFALCWHWARIPQRFHKVGDRYIWVLAHYLKLSHAHSPAHTICYRSHWQASYALAGEVPPPEATRGEDLVPLLLELEAYFRSGAWER